MESAATRIVPTNGGSRVLLGLALAVVAAAALAVPASASAATKIYGGTAAIGGKVAIDVKLNKQGVPKRITELRAVGVPGTCAISGPNVPLNATLPVNLKVAKDRTYEFKVTDSFGNTSHIEGKFNASGKKASGSFVYASHFPAEGPYPEEDCSSPKTGYSIKKGGPDAIETPPQAPRRATG